MHLWPETCLILQTRYNIKYRTAEGQLVLKVTDDRAVSLSPRAMQRRDEPASPGLTLLCSLAQCIKWRSDKREDLRKVEDLNMVFFKLMTSKS